MSQPRQWKSGSINSLRTFASLYCGERYTSAFRSNRSTSSTILAGADMAWPDEADYQGSSSTAATRLSGGRNDCVKRNPGLNAKGPGAGMRGGKADGRV